MQITSEVRVAAWPTRGSPRLKSTRPPPPPPLFRGGREASFGRASFTFKLRPPIAFPSKPAIAFAASSSLGISTNANPRARPVSRSFTRFTRPTCPNGLNSSFSSLSVVWKLRLPTNRLFIPLLLNLLCYPGPRCHSLAHPQTRMSSNRRLAQRFEIFQTSKGAAVCGAP